MLEGGCDWRRWLRLFFGRFALLRWNGENTSSPPTQYNITTATVMGYVIWVNLNGERLDFFNQIVTVECHDIQPFQLTCYVGGYNVNHTVLNGPRASVRLEQ